MTGFVLCALLGLLNVIGVLGAGMDQAPPLAIIIAGGVLGLVTVVAAVPAWRGNRTALLLVLASRVVSIPLGIPAYFTNGVSTATRVAVTVTLVAGVVAVALLAPAIRRNQAALPA